MFKGSFTALITPFKGGKVDEEAFQQLVEWQIAEGTHGLVPVGTTGESPTLSHEEHKRVVELCVEAARKRVPVIAGAGSNSTDEAIDLTRHAKKVGADAVLHSTGYYNKPTQEGLYRHFKAISDAVDMPIFIYNVPVRTIVDISVATLARCSRTEERGRHQGCDRQRGARHPAAAGLRQGFHPALGRGRHRARLHGARRRMAASRSPPTSPRACAPTSRTPASRATTRRALALQDRLMPLHDALFVETNPGPVKYAAWRLGLIGSPECRLPLAPISEATKKAVDEALARTGLLQAKAAE